MISNYLDSFANYIEEYKKNSRYYDSLIYDTKIELSNIDRDLNSNLDKDLYRAQIQAELVKSSLIKKLDNLKNEFGFLRFYLVS